MCECLVFPLTVTSENGLKMAAKKSTKLCGHVFVFVVVYDAALNKVDEKCKYLFFLAINNVLQSDRENKRKSRNANLLSVCFTKVFSWKLMTNWTRSIKSANISSSDRQYCTSKSTQKKQRSQHRQTCSFCGAWNGSCDNRCKNDKKTESIERISSSCPCSWLSKRREE